MTFEQIVTFFWVAILLVCAAWGVRLWGQGLATRYPLLLAFLVGEIILDLSGLVVYRWAGPESYVYFWFYVASRIASATLLFLVILQVYQRLVDDYQFFRQLGQFVLYGCVGLSSAVILGSIFLDPSADLRTLPGFWILQERGMYFALTLVMLGLLGFAYYFRLVPSRNVLTLFAVFGSMFISQALLWSIRNYWGMSFRSTRTLISAALLFFCMLAGTLLFSKAGETEGYAADYQEAAKRGGGKFTRRIEEINQALLDIFRL